MNATRRMITIALAVAILALSLMVPMPARANETGRRNTTIGLGAASAGMLIFSRNKLPGALVGGAAVYSYTRYQREHDRNQRLRRGYR